MQYVNVNPFAHIVKGIVVCIGYVLDFISMYVQMFSVWHSMALYGIVWQCHTELQTMLKKTFNTTHSFDH